MAKHAFANASSEAFSLDIFLFFLHDVVGVAVVGLASKKVIES